MLRAALGAWCRGLRLSISQWEAAREGATDEPKQLCFLVYSTFAKTEDDYDNDRGCKDVVKVVKYKELYENLGDDDRGKLHKYAHEKSESLRLAHSSVCARGLIVCGVRILHFSM